LSSAVVRHGVKLLIIDPWNEIETTGGSVREVLQKPLKRMVMVCG